MSIAVRARAADRTAEEAAVWAALEEVPDPEIPTISVVDLGIVRSVQLDPERIRVEILPTFVGCPAIEMMRAAIAERLAGMRSEVVVEVSFAEPWTTDRITHRGRERLRAGGFAPPGVGAVGSPRTLIPLLAPAHCPYCGSRRTRMENAFGPTLCRSIQYCLECHQPFEQFKTV